VLGAGGFTFTAGDALFGSGQIFDKHPKIVMEFETFREIFF
jgi:hypothetical protein